MQQQVFLAAALCFAAAMLAAGCVQPSGTPASPISTLAAPAVTSPAVQGPAAGLPNPASVHCIGQGGDVAIRRDAQGNEYGVCIFPNGSSCEEWAMYRGECIPGNITVLPTPTRCPVCSGH